MAHPYKLVTLDEALKAVGFRPILLKQSVSER